MPKQVPKAMLMTGVPFARIAGIIGRAKAVACPQRRQNASLSVSWFPHFVQYICRPDCKSAAIAFKNQRLLRQRIKLIPIKPRPRIAICSARSPRSSAHSGKADRSTRHPTIPIGSRLREYQGFGGGSVISRRQSTTGCGVYRHENQAQKETGPGWNSALMLALVRHRCRRVARSRAI